MRKLMQQDRGEEKERRCPRRAPPLRCTPIFVHVLEEAFGQPPGQQGEDSEPTPVHQDVDPRYPPQPEGTHCYSCAATPSGRTIRHGNALRRTTPSATLPMIQRFTPERPWVASAISPAPTSDRKSTRLNSS